MQNEISGLLNQLTVGLSFTSVYFRDHPRVREVADEFTRRLRLYLADQSQDQLFLGVVKGRIAVQGKLMVGPTLIARRYVDALEKLHSGGLMIQPDVYPGELIDFFTLCAEQAPIKDRESAMKTLEERGIRGIRLSPKYGEPGWLGDDEIDQETDIELDDLDTMINYYQSLLETVESSHESATRGHDVKLNNARSVVEDLIHSIQSNSDDLMALSRYPDYDNYTIGHSVRVALIALLVARQFEVSSRSLVEIGVAGLLHDVGKSKIPHEILYRPGRLSQEELRIMRFHPRYGGEILLEAEDSSPYSIGAAFGHHIRPDRRGYPRTPEWARIGSVTALIQVCDVFEALTAVRPYKPSLTPAQAYKIMLGDNRGFDQTMLKSLIRSMGLYPPGSPVRLSSNEQAVVCQAGLKLDRPLVRVTHDAAGIALPKGDQKTIQLDFREDLHVTEITLGDGTPVKVEKVESPPDEVMAQPRALEEVVNLPCR